MISRSISDYYSLTTSYKLALPARLSGINHKQVHVPVFLVLVTSGEKTEKSNRLRKLDTRVSLSSSIMLTGLLVNTVAKYGALIFDLYTCFG